MDEDDEFGDLYAGLGTSSAAEAPTTSAPSIPPPGTSSNAARFLDDDDDELYSGFASRRQDPPPRAPAPPDSIPRAQDFSEDLPENAPPGGAGDGSESDSDDDLQIVLNNDNKRKAAEVSVLPEQESIPGEGIEEDEAPGTVPTPSWPEDQHHHQQQQPQQQAGSFAEAQPLLPPPSPMGLPPGLLPPGLLPPDQTSRPGLPVAAPPPRPAGRPPFMHHAQYKYVRGPMVMGGPMMNSNPGVLGRGSFPPGWGPGKGPPPPGAGRPWGGPSHSEFHLPPTKSVFDMDLDAFDDKPWRHPNADISDYFNFGFNEVTWRMYCQQLSQLRLESTMQTKISVYESGRSEQPIGRAIQVEGGVGERRPSFDSRRNRNRDSNEVIEIVLCEAEVENHFIGNDYDGTMYDLDEPSRGSFMGRNSSYSDADGHFFPMGPRPRGPPYRMFPGGPYPGRGPRPAYYDPGHPMHMRPEGFGGDYGDSSRSRTKNSSQGRGAEDEVSSGSVAVKDDRKHGDERRSKSSRDRDEDVNSDEHKRSHSGDDKSERRHRRPEKDPKKEPVDADQSSRSDAEEAAAAEVEDDHRRSSRDEEPLESGGDRQAKRAPSSSEKERGKEEEWSRNSSRRREDEYRRSRDEESSRKRDEERSRRREKPEEYSWKRGRDRDDSKRRSGYDEYEYDRRDREDDRERGKRHGYEKSSAAEDEDYLRRKSSSKHESSGRKDSSSYRYEDEYYEHRRSSRREPELQKDEEKKYYSSGRSKESEKRNGSTSEYLDEKKRRKTGDYQKNAHAEKGLDEDSLKKGRKPGSKTEPGYREESYSSENDEDENRRRKGRSKMERLNRERPPQSKEDVEESLARMGSRHEIEGEKRSSSSAPEMRPSKVNGDRQEFLESVARRKERFMKMESSSKPSSIEREREKEKLAAAQVDTSEFKHERPARKRRWGS